ncbi:MAG: metalloregulator ArsR/SmtB family transcription factor [Candidatus Methanoplasma sp.]|jgi:ArsR family transcriptional regulator|nr:metalloregulator ArsR/SmtB family transcription factor [Candidatus Methanoplasma sp.]
MTHNEDHREKEHSLIVENAQVRMPDEKTIGELSDLFKIFSDPTRMKILWTIGDGEVCVCCISELLGMSVSAVSHQLKTLRQAQLVKARRDGKNIYYSLDDHHVKSLLDIALEHMGE